LQVDFERTHALLEQRCSEDAVDRLAQQFAESDLTGVIADAPPTALEAARRAGLPAVAVANFDWAWIYGHFGHLHGWADRFRAWQNPHDALALWPGPPLTGFRRVTPGPLVGRCSPPFQFPEKMPGNYRHVLVGFGGFGLADLDKRLPHIPGVRWVLAAPMSPLDRPDCLWIDKVPYPALVAGADAVLTKPGYGILAEAFLAGTPLAWFPRGDWPESKYLAAPMHERGDVQVGESVQAALTSLWSHPRPKRHNASGAQKAAAWILSQLF
jgi:L-arabinokinase